LKVLAAGNMETRLEELEKRIENNQETSSTESFTEESGGGETAGQPGTGDRPPDDGGSTVGPA
jgi:hypothetical protein